MNIGLIIGMWAAVAAIGLAVAVALFRTGKPVRRLVGSTVQGLCAIGVVNIAGAFTGISVGFNTFTAVCSAALGIPGVVGLLTLKIIFR